MAKGVGVIWKAFFTGKGRCKMIRGVFVALFVSTILCGTTIIETGYTDFQVKEVANRGKCK